MKKFLVLILPVLFLLSLTGCWITLTPTQESDCGNHYSFSWLKLWATGCYIVVNKSGDWFDDESSIIKGYNIKCGAISYMYIDEYYQTIQIAEKNPAYNKVKCEYCQDDANEYIGYGCYDLCSEENRTTLDINMFASTREELLAKIK